MSRRPAPMLGLEAHWSLNLQCSNLFACYIYFIVSDGFLYLLLHYHPSLCPFLSLSHFFSLFISFSLASICPLSRLFRRWNMEQFCHGAWAVRQSSLKFNFFWTWPLKKNNPKAGTASLNFTLCYSACSECVLCACSRPALQSWREGFTQQHLSPNQLLSGPCFLPWPRCLSFRPQILMCYFEEDGVEWTLKGLKTNTDFFSLLADLVCWVIASHWTVYTHSLVLSRCQFVKPWVMLKCAVL